MKSNILTVTKKELARFFKDKRIMIGLLMPGILIYVVYSVMGGALQNMYSPQSVSPSVYAVNFPDSIRALEGTDGWEKICDLTEITLSETEDVKDQIAAQDAELLLIFPADFDEIVAAYDAKIDKAAGAQIQIFYNSASPDSQYIYSLFTSYIDSYKTSLGSPFTVNMGQGQYDLATEKDVMGQVFSSMLPMLLMVFLFSGCMAVAPESIAGEKERGTIATLLVTPLKRGELAIGKIISLSLLALLSGASSFIGTFLAMPKLMGGAGLDASFYGASDFLLIFAVILSTVLLLVGLVSIVSAFAKSVREASMYVLPLMILSLLVGLSAMFGGGAAQNPVYFLIPLYSSVQCFSGIFSFSYEARNVVICLVSNVAYAGLCVFVMTRMFNSEKVMFSK